MSKDKPLMLTHEVEVPKGGGPLEELKCELDDQRLSDAIFSEERLITIWYRIADFQLISLKQLARFTLLHTPLYRGHTELDVYVPGELLQEALHFQKPILIYASPHNPGAQAFAAHLVEAYPHHEHKDIDNTRAPGLRRTQTHLVSNHHLHRHHHGISVTKELPVVLLGSGKTVARLGKNDSDVTHFLLYLNFNTYLNDMGQRLAEELRKARTAGLPIVMAHENDMALGGCEFSRFFTTTPQDLINDGLYNALAFAAYPGATHRAASVALLAKAFGAVSSHTNTDKSCLRQLLASTMSRNRYAVRSPTTLSWKRREEHWV